jgi:hypothetical protein
MSDKLSIPLSVKSPIRTPIRWILLSPGIGLRVDNLFNIVKMKQSFFWVFFCNFPTGITEKAGKKGEESNEKINKYNHKA